MILKTIEEQTGLLSCNTSSGVWHNEHNVMFNCIPPGKLKNQYYVNWIFIEIEGSAEPKLPVVNYTKIEEHIDEMARIIIELNKMDDTSSFTRTLCNFKLLLFLLSIYFFRAN